MNNEIVVLTGLSASGKDTLCQLLKEKYGYWFVISHTTRPMRPCESECNPYRFVSKEEFDTIPMIETRSYETLVDNVKDTWYYGVSKGEILDNRKYVVVLDVEGTIEFIQYFGDRVIPIYIYVDSEIRKQRSINRGGHNNSEWDRREVDDLKTFTKENINKYYKAIVKNKNLDDSIEEIMKVVKSNGSI
jgi:guanylate kinase